MNTGLNPQEGESFVDEAEKQIPPRNTWPELTTNELIELKLRLEDFLWTNHRNPVMAKTLNEGIAFISKLIESRVIS